MSRTSDLGRRKQNQKQVVACQRLQPSPPLFQQRDRAKRWCQSLASDVRRLTSDRFTRLASLLAIALLSTGCVSTYVGPPPPSQTSPSYPRPVEEASSSQPEPATSTKTEPGVEIRPGSEQTYRSARAVDGLLAEGWRLFEQQRYEASVSVAERALRIDRRNPQVYLLLARSYLLQSQPTLAQQFARQGLAFANSSEPVYQQLQELLKRR